MNIKRIKPDVENTARIGFGFGIEAGLFGGVRVYVRLAYWHIEW